MRRDKRNKSQKSERLTFWRFLKSYICDNLYLLRHPKMLIPTAVLGTIWTVLGVMAANAPLIMPLKVVSFLTFAQGGMYGGMVGGVAGIVGKVMVASFVNAMVIPLFDKKMPFSGVGGGIKGLFRSLSVDGMSAVVPLLYGVATALILYSLMNINQSGHNAMVGIVAIVMLLKSIGTRNGFAFNFLLSAANSMSRGRIPNTGTITRILTGLTIGFTLAVGLSVGELHWCSWLGLLLLIVAIVCCIMSKMKQAVVAVMLLIPFTSWAGVSYKLVDKKHLDPKATSSMAKSVQYKYSGRFGMSEVVSTYSGQQRTYTVTFSEPKNTVVKDISVKIVTEAKGTLPIASGYPQIYSTIVFKDPKATKADALYKIVSADGMPYRYMKQKGTNNVGWLHPLGKSGEQTGIVQHELVCQLSASEAQEKDSWIVLITDLGYGFQEDYTADIIHYQLSAKGKTGDENEDEDEASGKSLSGIIHYPYNLSRNADVFQSCKSMGDITKWSDLYCSFKISGVFNMTAACVTTDDLDALEQESDNDRNSGTFLERRMEFIAEHKADIGKIGNLIKASNYNAALMVSGYVSMNSVITISTTMTPPDIKTLSRGDFNKDEYMVRYEVHESTKEGKDYEKRLDKEINEKSTTITIPIKDVLKGEDSDSIFIIGIKFRHICSQSEAYKVKKEEFLKTLTPFARYSTESLLNKKGSSLNSEEYVISDFAIALYVKVDTEVVKEAIEEGAEEEENDEDFVIPEINLGNLQDAIEWVKGKTDAFDEHMPAKESAVIAIVSALIAAILGGGATGGSGADGGETETPPETDDETERLKELDRLQGMRWRDEQREKNTEQWNRERATGKTYATERLRETRSKLNRDYRRERMGFELGVDPDNKEALKEAWEKYRDRLLDESKKYAEEGDKWETAENIAGVTEKVCDVSISVLSTVTGPGGETVRNGYTFLKAVAGKYTEYRINKVRNSNEVDSADDWANFAEKVFQGTAEGALGVIQSYAGNYAENLWGWGEAATYIGIEGVKSGLQGYLNPQRGQDRMTSAFLEGLGGTAKGTANYGIGKAVSTLTESFAKAFKDTRWKPADYEKLKGDVDFHKTIYKDFVKKSNLNESDLLNIIKNKSDNVDLYLKNCKLTPKELQSLILNNGKWTATARQLNNLDKIDMAFNTTANIVNESIGTFITNDTVNNTYDGIIKMATHDYKYVTDELKRIRKTTRDIMNMSKQIIKKN